MISRRNKLFMWTIVVWFALLQAISPFLHAHLDGSIQAQGSGLHLHAEDTNIAPDDLIPTFRNATDAMHIVVVDKAVVKDIEGLLPILLAVLFVFAAMLNRPNIWQHVSHHNLRPIYLRPQSRPRAPPGF